MIFMVEIGWSHFQDEWNKMEKSLVTRW